MPEPTPVLQLDRAWYVYDYHVTPEATAQLRAMQIKYKGRWLIRKTWEGDAGQYDHSRHQAILFQVLQVIWWEMPHPPTLAPKGLQTTLQDVANFPEPSDELVQMIQDITGTVFSVFKQIGKSAKDTATNTQSAVTWLIWGGAAVLLFNLFRATKAS
jgi:hypothetical protein